MIPDSIPLIRKYTYFILLLAIMATTLLTWFNFNAQLIIALIILRLTERNPLMMIKDAFMNSFFLSCFFLCLIKCLGLLYDSDVDFGWYLLQKRATLVGIPFILTAGAFTNKSGREKIMTAFCWLLLLISLYCLVINGWQWLQERNSAIFFYHSLVTPISQNAIFYSVFLCFGLLYLLSSELYGLNNHPGLKKGLRIFLTIFFIGFILLLSSKLMLVILLMILISFLFRGDLLLKKKKLVLFACIAFLLLILAVLFTKNPIKDRYLDISRESVIKKEKITPGTYFNGVQLRILQWKFAYEILNENHAWILGVSPGDAQHKLDKKYADANMYMGDPNRHDEGFLNYNFHNQYIEELVQSGIIGLCIFLFSCYMLIQIGARVGTKEAWFTVFILLGLFFTESSLQMQDGLFLFTFFPCLLMYSKDNEKRLSIPFY